MSATQCPECGASYADAGDTCESRFALLLALDHSRQEPWGSRHGMAFAAFALQHPARFATSLDHAWAALFQIYAAHMDARYVFATLRANALKTPQDWAVPPRPAAKVRLPTMTIADLADFAADTYPDNLDAWCRATLDAWG